MNVTNCTDNELDAAVMIYLIAGAGAEAPIQIRAGTWLSGRAATKEAFAERFPRQMDQLKTKRTKR
jgi:hypothetical protein